MYIYIYSYSLSFKYLSGSCIFIDLSVSFQVFELINTGNLARGIGSLYLVSRSLLPKANHVSLNKKTFAVCCESLQFYMVHIVVFSVAIISKVYS